MMNNSKKIHDAGLSLTGKSSVALALGLGLGVCATSQVEAVIVHSEDRGFTPFTVSQDSLVQWDVNEDGNVDFIFNHASTGVRGNHGFEAFANVLSFSGEAAGVFDPDYVGVKNLAPGETVQPYTGFIDYGGFFFNVSGSDYFGEFYNSDGLMGFRIDVSDDGDATAAKVDFHYGWAGIDVEDDLSGYTITEWAYQDDGSPIAAGEGAEVPIPSSLLLLATGAAGLIGMRRKKR
jgi:hypothetical protein